MNRIALIPVVVFALLAGASSLAAQEDYTDELIKLYELTDSKQYREAINGYKSLQARPGTPGWFKAGAEYEIAELYGALNDTENAIAALNRAVQLGFDDCITPATSESLATVLKNPRAVQVLLGMKIAQADFRELVWLKTEALHTRHDSRMMIIENTNRLDHQITDVPQSQLPTRSTNSAGVLYWRQLLLFVQRVQRDYAGRADLARMKHVTTMAIISGGISPSAAIESARKAKTAADTRRAAIRARTFVPMPSLGPVKPCLEWAAGEQ